MRYFPILLLALPALAADPDGATLFTSRCAACHTANPPATADDRAPSRGELAAMTPEQIVDALVKGKMQIQARGMSQPEIDALAVALTGKALGSTTASTAGTCAGIRTKPFAPGASDWSGWGVDAVNSRYQPRPGLTATDVPKLRLKWAFGFPGDTRAVAQPAVVGGRIFVGSYSGLLYSLDAETGCVHWTYKVGTIARTGIVIAKAPGSGQWVAYFGDSAAYAHAVDAVTGKGLWKVKLDDHPWRGSPDRRPCTTTVSTSRSPRAKNSAPAHPNMNAAPSGVA